MANKLHDLREKMANENYFPSLKEKVQAGYPLTWQEKLKLGQPLTEIEEVKADADWNHNKRVRDEAEKKAFEELKSRGRLGGRPAEGALDDDEESSDDDDDSEDLTLLSRGQLDERAAALGVESPQDLPNKQAVIDAINEKGE